MLQGYQRRGDFNEDSMEFIQHFFYITKPCSITNTPDKQIQPSNLCVQRASETVSLVLVCFISKLIQPLSIRMW